MLVNLTVGKAKPVEVVDDGADAVAADPEPKKWEWRGADGSACRVETPAHRAWRERQLRVN